ncbi:MAG: DNA repair protein RecO [Holosporales bacterium]|jgi:DNA repair protein RecO (recombination protein O)|nr:DNA repair protein RecO [Holosporales bacterium]
MISWTDIGIVLSAKRHGEKYKIVNIFTKEHGKFSAMVSNSKSNAFSIFSNVVIDYSTKTQESMGFWKLKSEKQDWIFFMKSENHVLVSQGICFLLNKLLPLGAPYEKLFNFTKHLLGIFQNFSKSDILLLYVYFEFVLLDNIGFGKRISDNFDLNLKFNSFLNLSETIDKNDFEKIKHSLSVTKNIIEDNLLKIDNYYRSSIIRLI